MKALLLIASLLLSTSAFATGVNYGGVDMSFNQAMQQQQMEMQMQQQQQQMHQLQQQQQHTETMMRQQRDQQQFNRLMDNTNNMLKY